ncbi:drug resistance transporter EmrB/QacA subfamily [Zopfia rhizophila CBS 207.26]|uniref:Drug resistance transporter EmrB/QacA subfamily n=1 Tax=Zopfia rhizophila CBS 207.26 TaxID=1314779 RepID=A0A6A6DXA2_9PEZI|nr:drug resistance transporter EmrB/QacA subfamily [Zopfia rhizophila CBS 207.26]
MTSSQSIEMAKAPLAEDTVEATKESDVEELGNFQSYYLSGWKLYVFSFGMCLAFFLATLESTIVSTSLLPITNSLHSFQKSSWIVTAYLLTFSGFLLVIAKLSDIFGRKVMITFSIIDFIIFSIACGVSKTVVQLAVFRAFQGIGGGGIFTLTFIVLPEIVAPAQYATLASLVSAVLAISSLLGPILGGAISDHGDWKWIFLINAPAGAVALALILITLPGKSADQSDAKLTLAQKLGKIDYVGTFLVLATCVLFVAALEQGGTGYSWKSSVVLSMLIISLFCAIGALIWSWHLAPRHKTREPILAWNLLTNRFSLGLFLSAFFAGSAFISAIVILPQQFQVVFHDSPARSGYRLLCLTFVAPFFSAVSGVLNQKKRIPPLYILLVGQSLIIIGCGLASSISETDRTFPKAQYGYQVIMGAGFGLTLTTVVVAAPLAFTKKDVAVGIGTTNQFRNLGGSIGISICANILNNSLSGKVKGLLTPEQFGALKGSAEAIKLISPSVQEQVREAFAKSFTRQMYAVTSLAAAGLLFTLIMVERRPRFQQA